MTNIIDLRPIIDQVIFPFIETAIVPGIGIIVTKAAQYLHVKITETQSRKVEDAIWNGINFALGQAQVKVDELGQLETKNKIVAIAANYIIPKVPSAIKTLKISEKGLNDRIFARVTAQALTKPE